MQLKWLKYQKPKDENTGWMKQLKTQNLQVSNLNFKSYFVLTKTFIDKKVLRFDAENII